MSIKIACPCGHSLEFEDRHRGKHARCNACGRMVLIEDVEDKMMEFLEASPESSTSTPLPLSSKPSVGSVATAPTVATMPAGRICPHCGESLGYSATACGVCGTRIRAGGAAEGKAGTVAKYPSGAPPHEPITLVAVLQAAFDSDVVSAAVTMTLKWLLVLPVMAPSLVYGLAWEMVGGYTEVVLIVLSLPLLGFYLWYLARVFGCAMGLANQFQTGAYGFEPPSLFVSFGFCILLSLMTGVPIVTGAFIAMSWAAFLAGPYFVLLLMWVTLYLPMAVAVAGAYFSVDPHRVLKAIGQTLPAYLLVLIFASPLVCATAACALALLVLLSYLLSSHPFLLGMSASLVLLAMGVYPLMATSAMLGRMLRKYAQNDRLTSQEVASAAGWIGGAVVTAIALVALDIVLLAVLGASSHGSRTPLSSLTMPKRGGQASQLPPPSAETAIADSSATAADLASPPAFYQAAGDRVVLYFGTGSKLQLQLPADRRPHTVGESRWSVGGREVRVKYDYYGVLTEPGSVLCDGVPVKWRQ